MIELIQKVRAFNRYYMPAMKLLGNHYLGSEYSVTEARIFFEVYENEGCQASHIAQTMNIDKSYLRRILAAYEKQGYLRRKSSATDRRAYALYLTKKGKQRAEEFIRMSNEEIGHILGNLTEEEQRCMEAALDTIIHLLSKGGNHEDCAL